jgi:hypothetical protein
MKVKDLIEQLSKLDPDANVVLQKDSEGNGYSPCAGAEEALYVAGSTYSGQVFNLDDDSTDVDMEDDEWEKIKSNKKNKCVVLWPTN